MEYNLNIDQIFFDNKRLNFNINLNQITTSALRGFRDKGIFRYYSFINLIIRWRMFYIYLKLNQIEIFFCRKNSWKRISWYKFKVESNVSPFVYNYSVFSIPLYLRVIKKKVASKWLHIELNQNYFLPWSGLIHSYFLIAVKS